MVSKTLQQCLLSLTFISATVCAQNVATVNGTVISTAKLNDMVQQITAQPNGPKDTPELREKVKNELINREILFQAAEKAGLAKTAEVKQQLDMARQSILIQALAVDFIKKNPVSDADVKAEYDRAVKQAGDKEYHVEHILVKTAEEAKSVIAKLKAGSKFDELAKQLSQDPGSANKGGDLGWATPDVFVAPFAQAITHLQKGQFTQTPVETQFGFHIIKLEDTRPIVIPPFDSIKKQILTGLEQQKFIAYQEALRKKATIK